MEHRLNEGEKENETKGWGETRVSANASMPLERNIFVPSPLTLERY